MRAEKYKVADTQTVKEKKGHSMLVKEKERNCSETSQQLNLAGVARKPQRHAFSRRFNPGYD